MSGRESINIETTETYPVLRDMYDIDNVGATGGGKEWKARIPCQH